MDTEIVEIARTDTTVTLKANPSDTSNNNLYVWNTGDIAQEITTDKDQKILCFPCENSRISTKYRGDYYEIYDEPYTPEERWTSSNTTIDSRNTDAITITTARIKINSEGRLIKTHVTYTISGLNDHIETFYLYSSKDGPSKDGLSSGSGGVYITYGWYELTSWYYAKSETVFLPDFDISKYHNYTIIYHKVDASNSENYLWDIDLYVDDKRVMSQRSVNHIYVASHDWNYLPNCSYKFVRNTIIRGVSSIPEANEYTQLLANITASRNPVTTNVPALSTSELTCHVDGIIDRDNDRYKQYIEHDWGEVDFSVFPPKLICTDGNILAPTSDEVGGHGGSVFKDDSGDNVFKVKELYCKDWEQTQSIFLSRNENNTGISIEYDFRVSNLSTLTSPNTENSCVLYTTGSMTSYFVNILYIHLLNNGKYIINSSNTPRGGDIYYSSEELDIDFSDWVHVEVIYIYTEEYLSNAMYLKINGVLIPFTGPGANEDGSSKNDYIYWYYSFSSYTNWYGNEEVYLKNFKLKTLTLNPDYEEYPELTYLWNTGETTKQITVQPTEPNTYTCTVTQGSRTANASILIDTTLKKDKPIAVISPQEKPYIEHMIGRFYATNSYDINNPVSPIVKYIWNDVETVSPVFVTRVKRTDKIRLRVVNALGLESDEVEVDLSKDTDQWGNKYKFLDIPMFLICSKGANLFDTLISRFPIPSSTLDLYSNFYPTEYDKYTSIGFTTDISTDTIRYMACLPHYGVAEYTANREQVDIYPLGISWLEKRNMLKYFDKTKNSKGSLLACIGHPELGEEEGYSSLEWVLNSLGIITPKDRYSIPRLLDLLELLLMDYENGGLIKL